MSKVIGLTDAPYAALEAAAAERHETPQALVERWLIALTESQGPVYYTDDDPLRALGADDEELAELAKLDHADE